MHYKLNQIQLRQLKLLYGRRTNRELSKHFGVSVAEIESEAKRHCLAKDKRTFKGRKMPRWSKEEIERLREIYPDTSNLHIARALGRSVKAIVSKAHNLKLKKDEERLTEMGRQNVQQRSDRQRQFGLEYMVDELEAEMDEDDDEGA